LLAIWDPNVIKRLDFGFDISYGFAAPKESFGATLRCVMQGLVTTKDRIEFKSAQPAWLRLNAVEHSLGWRLLWLSSSPNSISTGLFHL